MKAQSTVIALAALLVGAALGYFVPPLFSNAAEPAEENAKEEAKVPGKRASRTRAQSSREHDTDLNRLRARIKDLERQLAERTETAEPVGGTSTNRVEGFRPFGHPPTAAEMRARFEEMRERDPQRYTQMTNNMARWRTHRQARLQNQFDILASADTTHMTKEQRRVHETYQDLLVRQEELHELMNPNNTDVTDAQREAAFKEMREIGHKLHDLQRTERDTLLTQTANSLGLRGQQAHEVVTAIKAVYEATGGGHGRGWGRGPGGGGRHR